MTDEQKSLQDSLENVAAREYDSDREQPSPEQLLMKLAIERLNPKQRQIWDWYAYDQKSQEEIGQLLGIKQQAVQQRINVIENKIKKFVEQNLGSYMLLRLDKQLDERYGK